MAGTGTARSIVDLARKAIGRGRPSEGGGSLAFLRTQAALAVQRLAADPTFTQSERAQLLLAALSSHGLSSADFGLPTAERRTDLPYPEANPERNVIAAAEFAAQRGVLGSFLFEPSALTEDNRNDFRLPLVDPTPDNARTPHRSDAWLNHCFDAFSRARSARSERTRAELSRHIAHLANQTTTPAPVPSVDDVVRAALGDSNLSAHSPETRVDLGGALDCLRRLVVLAVRGYFSGAGDQLVARSDHLRDLLDRHGLDTRDFARSRMSPKAELVPGEHPEAALIKAATNLAMPAPAVAEAPSTLLVFHEGNWIRTNRPQHRDPLAAAFRSATRQSLVRYALAHFQLEQQFRGPTGPERWLDRTLRAYKGVLVARDATSAVTSPLSRLLGFGRLHQAAVVGPPTAIAYQPPARTAGVAR